MKLQNTLLAAAIAVFATCGVASAQQAGRLYVFHSAAMGGCPALDWHVTTGADGSSLSGMISWDNMKSMAHATGTIGADKSIKMTATEVGGTARTATIDGKVRADGWLVVNVKAPNVTCTDIKIPYYVAPVTAG
jgi:hypothetical protein